MISISFHVLSLIVGFLIGTFVVALATILLLFDERWSIGFGEGWNHGKEYGEKQVELCNNLAKSNNKEV